MLDLLTATTLLAVIAAVFVLGVTAGLVAGWWIWCPRGRALEFENPKPLRPRAVARPWQEWGEME